MNYQSLWHLLTPFYGEGEAKAIARMVYEVRFGLTFTDLCIGKDTQLSQDDQTKLEKIAQRLERHEPVQYILGQTDFCGHTFVVNQHVLIPRPETEELCRWILSTIKGQCSMTSSKHSTLNCLDIGTGSGCIAITLAAELPEARVTAWDISKEALKVAQENAIRTHVDISFERMDILNAQCLTPNTPFSLIVSNPPYICNKECTKMEQNVLDYEPHEALFVPNDDPLLFYRAIAEYGRQALKPDGWLYFEINPLYANELHELLSTMSWHDIEIKEDQFGKQRFIRAHR